MSNGIVDANLVSTAPEEPPQELVQHTIRCMRVAYSILGTSAETEPGKNLDQLTLILAKLVPSDISELFRILEVPLLDKEQAQ